MPTLAAAESGRKHSGTHKQIIRRQNNGCTCMRACADTHSDRHTHTLRHIRQQSKQTVIGSDLLRQAEPSCKLTETTWIRLINRRWSPAGDAATQRSPSHHLPSTVTTFYTAPPKMGSKQVQILRVSVFYPLILW